MTGLQEDLPLLAAILLILGGLAFTVSAAGLPGLGDFNNPFDTILEGGTEPAQTYDLQSQFRVSATLLGDVEVDGFAYETQPNNNLLSIGSLPSFSLTGAEDVRISRTLTNTETGKVYLSKTVTVDQVAGGETVTVNTNAGNLKPGKYVLDVKVTYDPSWADVTDWDNTKNREFNIKVPKVVNR